MAVFDLDTIHTYLNDSDLLAATLAGCERLLWELEYLAKKNPQEASPDITNRLNLVKAQILLLERLMIGERIDSLVILVEHYAEILSQPHVGIGTVSV